MTRRPDAPRGSYSCMDPILPRRRTLQEHSRSGRWFATASHETSHRIPVRVTSLIPSSNTSVTGSSLPDEPSSLAFPLARRLPGPLVSVDTRWAMDSSGHPPDDRILCGSRITGRLRFTSWASWTNGYRQSQRTRLTETAAPVPVGLFMSAHGHPSYVFRLLGRWMMRMAQILAHGRAVRRTAASVQ